MTLLRRTLLSLVVSLVASLATAGAVDAKPNFEKCLDAQGGELLKCKQDIRDYLSILRDRASIMKEESAVKKLELKMKLMDRLVSMQLKRLEDSVADETSDEQSTDVMTRDELPEFPTVMGIYGKPGNYIAMIEHKESMQELSEGDGVGPWTVESITFSTVRVRHGRSGTRVNLFPRSKPLPEQKSDESENEPEKNQLIPPALEKLLGGVSLSDGDQAADEDASAQPTATDGQRERRER